MILHFGENKKVVNILRFTVMEGPQVALPDGNISFYN
jgi:hypothetical protein